MQAPPKMPPLPPRIAKLPRNARGYPVPFFVAWINGVPDFRMVRPEVIRECVRKSLCWICGETLGAQSTFAIGPMCCVNRNNAEPPSHRACAEFAAQACPFMLNPGMVRREDEMTKAHEGNVAGISIRRNPGVMACWSTKKWKTKNDPTGLLFDIGEPSHISWWREGRAATREEVRESILSGVPILERYCEDQSDLNAMRQAVVRTLLLVDATT